MELSMILIFFLGYVMIALEHKININKAGIALIMGVLLWVIYIMSAYYNTPLEISDTLKEFISKQSFPDSATLSDKYVKFISSVELPETLADISATLFFLLGAMTIVEMIDVHGGFEIITNRVTEKNKSKLLWIITGLTFFMSAALDNMTTSIVMIMMVRRLVYNYKERWIFAGIIIISANSGGAWSPIGDITTIILWMNDNITSSHIIGSLFIPCAVSVVIPTYLASHLLRGEVTQKIEKDDKNGIDVVVSKQEKKSIFWLGLCCLVSIPFFKVITNLPPYMGMLLSLSIMWIYTEYMYSKKTINERLKYRIPRVLKKVDIPTILFFLGLLLAVGAMKHVGILGEAAQYLEDSFGNIYAINTVIGVLSSIVDNVPLVAASISMYPVVDATAIASSVNPEFMQYFVVDGAFWDLLAFCAGTGGSLLIIGSVAGVVTMGIEKITFAWYFKKITFLAFIGYVAGILTFMLQYYLIHGTL